MPNRQKRKAEEKRSLEPQARAVSPTLRMSATKVRRVCNLVRGLPAAQALQTCDFLPHRGAPLVKDAVRQAMANAENNCGLEPSELVVTRIWADEGFTIPRIRPRAQGRAFRIRKRTCKVTVELGEREEE